MNKLKLAIKRAFAGEHESEYERECRERREQHARRHRCLNMAAHKLPPR